MGNCLTRAKAEMVPPPPRSGNWDQLSPQRPVSVVKSKRQTYGNEQSLTRQETPSGIEGLTYDHAGRPVWRDPQLKSSESNGDSPRVQHIEISK